MASTSMKKLMSIGKFKFYFAGKRFCYQGLWVWSGKNNIRLLPFNQFSNWFGRTVED